MRKAAIIGLTLCAVAAGCDDGPTSAQSDRKASLARHVSALKVYGVTTPPLKVAAYRTSGTYPAVSGLGIDLVRVNRALREAVLDEQRRYARFARKRLPGIPKTIQRRYPGTFSTATQLTSISASSVVVSALIPIVELLPGGNNGAVWTSVTVRVPSGSPVRLRDLFNDPSQGIEALAIATRRRALASNTCVRESRRDPLVGASYMRGFAPSASNYRDFALTARGLMIGFPIGHVAKSYCSAVKVLVGYRLLRPYFSNLGVKLITGVRQPRR